MSDQNLLFEVFDVTNKSLYIVEGSANFGVYHIIKASKQNTKEQLLLFVLQGSLKIDLRNWEIWRDCSKAKYQIQENDENVIKMSFDVDPRIVTADHLAKYPTEMNAVDNCINQNVPMFIINEKDFKVKESEFPMKLKRVNAAKGREVKNIIDINCSHLLGKKTPDIKTKFLSGIHEPFLTKVQIVETLKKVTNTKRKAQAEKIGAKQMKEDIKTTPPSTSGKFHEIEKIEEINEDNLQEKNSDKNSQKDMKEDDESANWSKKMKGNQEAPQTAANKPLTLTQENMLVLGLKLPVRDITPADTKLPPWTNLSRKIYREKKTLFDNKYASKWMRWWFEEHEDMPESPDNPQRSGYAIYAYEKQTELNCFNNKGMIKKIGGMWKDLPEDEKSSYLQRNVEQKEQFDRDVDEYQNELKNWTKKKQAKPKRTDGKPDCNCQYCLGEESE